MQTELEIEPRYPLIGGWKTAFTIGYGLPLHDFLFQSDGKRFIDINFGCPMNDVVINTLIVKVGNVAVFLVLYSSPCVGHFKCQNSDGYSQCLLYILHWCLYSY